MSSDTTYWALLGAQLDMHDAVSKADPVTAMADAMTDMVTLLATVEPGQVIPVVVFRTLGHLVNEDTYDRPVPRPVVPVSGVPARDMSRVPIVVPRPVSDVPLSRDMSGSQRDSAVSRVRAGQDKATVAASCGVSVRTVNRWLSAA